MADAQGGNRFSNGLAVYAGSGIMLRFFRLAYSYAKPKFMAPAQLGLWNLLYLAPTYAGYLHLGARNAIEFRLPELIAAGKIEDAERLKATVYRFTLAQQLGLSVLLVIAALVFPGDLETRVGLAALAPLILLLWYSDLQLTVLKAEQNFGIISRINAINAAALVAIGLPLVYFFQLYGVFAAALLTRLILAGFLRAWRPLEIHGNFDRDLLFGLIRQGFPILAFTASLVLLGTVDRMIIGALLGVEALGYYALAIVAAAFILQVPIAARDMMEPAMMAKLAKTNEKDIWEGHFSRPSLNVAAYFPFMLGAVAFMTEDILSVILPRYVISSSSVILLSFGCYFLALVQVMRGILVANGWMARSLPFHLIGILVNLGLSYAWVRMGYGIEAVALASSLSFAVVFFLICGYLLVRGPYGMASSVRHLGGVVVPFLVTIVAVTVLNVAVQPTTWPFGVASLVKLIFFMGIHGAVLAGMRRVFPSIRGIRGQSLTDDELPRNAETK